MSQKKYANRSTPAVKIDNNSTDNWLNTYLDNLKKVSVQSRTMDESIYDRISSIMGVKSKYPTVEAAVEDMQERSGLKNYLQQIKEAEKDISNKKQASLEFSENIKNTIDNYIEDTQGNLSIPAIIEKVKNIHAGEVDNNFWNNDKLFTYINDKNIEVKKKYPAQDQYNSHLGKINFNDSDIDNINSDVFSALTPTTAQLYQNLNRMIKKS